MDVNEQQKHRPGALPPSEAEAPLGAAERLLERVLERTRELTDGGKRIDDYQVLAERVAYAATEARAARALWDFAAEHPDVGELQATAAAAVADLVTSLRDRLAPAVDDLGLGEEVLETTFPTPLRSTLRAIGNESAFRALGERVVAQRGDRDLPLDEIHEQVRATVRTFAEQEIAPHAERIHRRDETLPEAFIEKMAALGYFGLSIPERYGGSELGSLAMILTTEELSRASLAAAGSLITRPEILAKALLEGGSEAQRAAWLPRLANGEVMVAISVTEPDVGSDVASLKCRAERQPEGGGYRLHGAKAWCTFAGRADLLAVLARTDPDPAAGAKGLSLFMVPKPRFRGHRFEVEAPGGGKLSGSADATLGYRGMHSFTLQFENFPVPADHLVGEEAGLGRGFYLQMAGFAAGRLQTGGRAAGVAAAALAESAAYTIDRIQFGKPIADYPLTRYKLGRMAARLAAARAITYAAAEAMDARAPDAALLASQAKLLACDVAVEVSQEGQQLHGGWGYAEEYAISRYAVDALVLPIFEGVKPILELKVIARNLLSA